MRPTPVAGMLVLPTAEPAPAICMSVLLLLTVAKTFPLFKPARRTLSSWGEMAIALIGTED